MIRWMESGTLSTCFVEMELELCWAFNRIRLEFHWYHTLKILVLYLDYGGLYLNIHILIYIYYCIYYNVFSITKQLLLSLLRGENEVTLPGPILRDFVQGKMFECPDLFSKAGYKTK